MMDLKGTWKCRNGSVAEIQEYAYEMGGCSGWYGKLFRIEDKSAPWEHRWDEDGNDGTGRSEWDLMERLSDKWSSERALG